MKIRWETLRPILLVSIVFCLALKGKAEETLVLEEDDAKEVRGQCSILRIPEGRGNVEAILRGGKKAAFQPCSRDVLREGITSGEVWFRFRLENESERKKWILSLENEVIDTAVLYVPKEGGGYEAKYTGAGVPWEERDVQARSSAFEIHPKGEEQLYYLALESYFPLNGSIKISSRADFIKEEQIGLTLSIVYFALGFFMICLAMGTFWYMKDKVFLLYIGTNLSMMGGIAVVSGMGMQFLWPNSPLFNVYLSPVMIFTSVFFVNGVVRKMLRAHLYAPSWDKLAKWLQYLALGFLVLPLFRLTDFYLIHDIAITMDFLSIIILTAIGIYALKQKYLPAVTYFVGFIGLAIGVLFFILGDYFNWFPSHLGYFSICLGSAWEMIFFLISLVTRQKVLEQEKVRMQQEAEAFQKQVEELEQRITSDQAKAVLPIPEHMTPLSKREKEVVSLMAQGLTDQQVAEELNVSLTTAKTHARNIYSKMLVNNRTEAVAVAKQYGMLN